MTVYGGLSVFFVLFTLGMIWHMRDRRKKNSESNSDNQSDKTNGDVTYNGEVKGKMARFWNESTQFFS